MTAIGELEKVIEENEGKVSLAQLDTYRNKKTAATYKVTECPTVILFDKGEAKGRIDGAFTADDVRKLLKEVSL